jgi:hypothetical protein
LLNLFLSMLAAVEAPVILMSKNRQGRATSIVDPVNEGASIRRAIIPATSSHAE